VEGKAVFTIAACQGCGHALFLKSWIWPECPQLLKANLHHSHMLNANRAGIGANVIAES
jgi:hypothetical protein